MYASRGNISAHRLFNLQDIGINHAAAEPHIDRVIQVFLDIGEAVAARWIQMPKGILLLQMAPGNPASGALYVYDREGKQFYLLSFEGADDTLTVQDFHQLLPEYDLMRYLEQPELLTGQLPAPGSA